MNLNKYKLEINKYEILIDKYEKEKNLKLEKRKQNYKSFKELDMKIVDLKKRKDELISELKGLDLLKSSKISEINRTKTDLRYKTAQQYEEMINKIQNDMYNNSNRYSKTDEIKLLNQIAILNREKLGLDKMIAFKVEIEELNEKYSVRKKTQDELHRQLNALNDKKYQSYQESLKLKQDIDLLIKCINEYKLKIKEIKDEYTKNIKNRQEYHKRIAMKKIHQNDFNMSANKIREQILKYEENKRDCLRLIKFLERFTQTNNDSSSLSTSVITSSLDKSQCSLNNSQNASINKTTLDQVDNVSFVVYKKSKLEDECCCMSRSKQKIKNKSLQKTISYTLNELTLFNELQIKEPKNCSQVDDVLLQLNYKQDECRARIESLEFELRELEDYFNSKEEFNSIINDIIDVNNEDDEDLIKSSIETLDTLNIIHHGLGSVGVGGGSSIYSDTNSEISNFDYKLSQMSVIAMDDGSDILNEDDRKVELNDSQKTFTTLKGSSDDGSDTTTIRDDNLSDKESSTSQKNENSSQLTRQSSQQSKTDAVLGLQKSINVTQAQLNKINLQDQLSDGYGSPGSQLSNSSTENNVYFQQS